MKSVPSAEQPQPPAVPPAAPPAQSCLADWLNYCERLHPVEIDMGLERVRHVAQRMDLKLSCPVITVAGTNGKGSTCAMLESIFMQSGYRTGLYTSPHLVHFEERCRLNGENVAAQDLAQSFAAVEQARGDTSLSYFEFSTLASLHRFQHTELDVVILEVGLGGRLDAINIIDTDCAIITSVDIDHVAILGDNREAIGLEKAGIMRTHKPVIVSDPMPPQSVLDHAFEIDADLWRCGQDFECSGDKQQWTWRGRDRRYSGLAYPALRGANQLLNASGVLAALEALRGVLPVNAQAIRQGLSLVNLPGRFQVLAGQPAVVLDVAHNPHAVAVLAQNLDAMGFFPQTHAVWGAMADKDTFGMLQRMHPLVDHWYFTDLPTSRAQTAEVLQTQWKALPKRAQTSGQTFADPAQAFAAARQAAAVEDRIVVFGSFYTVGEVLRSGT